jgi:hypothetical protein
MPNCHTLIADFSILPDPMIQEALTGNYKKHQTPYSFAANANQMKASNFYKKLEDSFGEINVDYLKNEPNSLYDWHVDYNRSCSINWVIQTNPKAVTLFRTNHLKPFFWDIEEVQYELYKPTVLDTTKSHCVINNYFEERIILSLSIFKKNAYNEVVNYLQNLSPKDYS